MLRQLCNAIVRKVQQRNRDSKKDTAPGIHFVKKMSLAYAGYISKNFTLLAYKLLPNRT